MRFSKRGAYMERSSNFELMRIVAMLMIVAGTL